MAQSLWLDVEEQVITMVDLVRSLKKHFYGIMNAIMLGEEKMTCGFRNIERFQNAIMFHFGGLDLYPALPTR